MSLARSEAPVRGLGRAVVDARWILFFGLVVFAGRIEESGLGGDGLRQAAVAREMATTGSWMLPSLGGDVYLKKPPLLFWSTATAIEVLGFSMLAAPVFASRRARVYLALRGGASPQPSRSHPQRIVVTAAIAESAARAAASGSGTGPRSPIMHVDPDTEE